MSHYRAVILDLDGTLVDSNQAHVFAWERAFAEQEHHFSQKQIHQWIGMGGDQLIPAALGISAESAQGRSMVARHDELIKQEYLPHLRAFPQGRELLQRMCRDGLRLVVATSAKEEMAQELMRLAQITDLVEGRTSADVVEHSKPAPDIIRAALRQLGLPAEQVIMLGDSPYDIEAAQQCGVAVIALRGGGFSDAALADAVAIYDDPADLLAQYDESPLAAL